MTARVERGAARSTRATNERGAATGVGLQRDGATLADITPGCHVLQRHQLARVDGPNVDVQRAGCRRTDRAADDKAVLVQEGGGQADAAAGDTQCRCQPVAAHQPAHRPVARQEHDVARPHGGCR